MSMKKAFLATFLSLCLLPAQDNESKKEKAEEDLSLYNPTFKVENVLNTDDAKECVFSSQQNEKSMFSKATVVVAGQVETDRMQSSGKKLTLSGGDVAYELKDNLGTVAIFKRTENQHSNVLLVVNQQKAFQLNVNLLNPQIIELLAETGPYLQRRCAELQKKNDQPSPK